MARPEYLSLRITPNRTRWLDALCRRLELEPNSKGYQQAINYALMAAIGGTTMGTVETTDRVKQVDWLRDLAGNIADWSTGGETAEELVEYARSKDGTEYWEITWPSWFDYHDRDLLVPMVAVSLS